MKRKLSLSLVGNSRTYQEEVEKVNLVEDGEIKEVKIGTSFYRHSLFSCSGNTKTSSHGLMNEDMPGLDTDMVVHHFPLRTGMQAS